MEMTKVRRQVGFLHMAIPWSILRVCWHARCVCAYACMWLLTLWVQLILAQRPHTLQPPATEIKQSSLDDSFLSFDCIVWKYIAEGFPRDFNSVQISKWANELHGIFAECALHGGEKKGRERWKKRNQMTQGAGKLIDGWINKYK